MCLLVGTIVTLVGALAPAVRATRVAPVEALREASAPSRGRLARLTPILAGLCILGGAGLVIAGLLAEGGDTSTKLLGAAGGAVVLILGIALISPRFVGPAARVVAWPAERFTKLVGRLARENSTRHPGRTAVTSAALMIGLALVVFVTIFANGLRASVSDLIDRTLAGDIAVLHDDGFTPIPAAVVPAVAKVDGVAAASPIRDTQTKIGRHGTKNTHAIDPATIGQVYNFDWIDGSQKSLDELGPTRRPARGERRHRRRLQGRRQGRDQRPERQRRPHRGGHLQGRRAARGHHHGPGPVRPARRPEARVESCWSRPTRARACPPCRRA